MINIKLFKWMMFSVCVYCLIFEFMIIKDGISDTVKLWLEVILPSVFPYMIIANYIANSDMMTVFEKFPGKYMTRIFNISRCSVRAILCSLICGYPSGAICASELYRAGYIEKNQAARLICYTNNAGPLFLISAVGNRMIGSAKDGAAIYIIQILAAIIYAVFSGICSPKVIESKRVPKNYDADFCNAVNKSVSAVINICGFMIASFVVSKCIVLTLDKIHPVSDNVTAIITAVFEISSGTSRLAMPYMSPAEFGTLCAFVSWAGIAVIMQIKSVAGEIISTGRICTAKLIQASVSFVLGFAYKKISIQEYADFGNDYLLKLSLGVGIVLFIYHIIKAKKDLLN